jgi:signal transduction histidine kinase
MFNILENAVQASPAGAEIQVQCKNIGIASDPCLEVIVRDQGPGLTPEQRQRILEPFYTTKAKGTGLGMAIVQRIVQAHGGQVRVGDTNGQGAEIVVIFPQEQK